MINYLTAWMLKASVWKELRHWIKRGLKRTWTNKSLCWLIWWEWNCCYDAWWDLLCVWKCSVWKCKTAPNLCKNLNFKFMADLLLVKLWIWKEIRAKSENYWNCVMLWLVWKMISCRGTARGTELRLTSNSDLDSKLFFFKIWIQLGSTFS